jgi:mRNA-degrading endonuclease toxin of MazEF toxin-antitoxin module
MADCGLVAKIRPVLVLAVFTDSDARALLTVAPLTSQLRGQRGEVPLGKINWLPKPSTVNVQGLAAFSGRTLVRRLGALDKTAMNAVKDALRDWLDL